MTTLISIGCSLLLLGGAGVDSAPPKHFIFFGHDRDRIRDREFLDSTSIAGAQLKYTWKELEPERGSYALEPMKKDCAYLAAHQKKLWVQIQDVSFDDRVLVPDYLRRDAELDGGVAEKFDGDDEATERSDGWVARRWDPGVQERFGKLLEAIAAELDGRIEGLNLPETAISFGKKAAHQPRGFTPEAYALAVRATLTRARRAFKKSHVMQYANFMPGEWLPGEDHGHLRGVHEHAASIGAGVGGPDLLPFRKGQRQHSLPLIARRPAGVIAGLAVQDGNLDEIDPRTHKRVTAPELYRHARDELRLDYVFWGTQEPHFQGEVLPLLRSLEKAALKAR